MAGTRYFPAGVFEEPPDLEDFFVSHCTSFLEAMKEEPLYPVAPEGPTIYRFLYLPTFTNPSVVRISKGSNGWDVVAKVTDGAGGYFAGDVAWEVERTLGAEESERLEQLLRSVAFWNMPVREDRFGLDGAYWIIEGFQAGKYHVIHRWSPKQGPLVKFGEYLMAVSGVKDHPPIPANPKWLAAMKAATLVREEKNRRRLEAIERANDLSRPLAVRLAKEGLTCPYCHKRSSEIRFVDGSRETQAYFICLLCGRSVRAEDLELTS